MQHLILLRHSKAVRHHEAPDDLSRGLTARGRREAGEAGAAIAALGLTPSAGLISPSLRTRETWKLASAAMPWQPKAIVSEGLYSAGPEDIWDLAEATGAEGVIVVGHNPGLGELVAHLIQQSHARSKGALALMEHLPTSGFAAFELTGETFEAPGPNLLGWGRLRED
ncbi:MAG: histidine phosphatase family protein [Hyphomonadaceae bacterium]|nr:histidine phosphatase family protein [Hyphomonadaceae bacterium]